MSHFYGILNGNRGDATRAGTKNSGFTAHAAGWKSAIRTELTHRNGNDYYRVWLTPWQGSGGSETLLAEGVLNASLGASGPHEVG